MITVNLLPHEFRPIKRTPLPYLLSGAALVLSLTVVGFIYIVNVANIAVANRTLNQHRTELNQLKPVVEEYNSISEKKLQLAEQVETINQIVGDRILWSRQLFNLNRLALENMWYDGIQVALKPFSETRTTYNPQKKVNETVTVKVDRRVLTLSGYVVAGNDGKSSVSPFTLATDSDPEFSGLFQLDKSTFKDTMFEDVGVREFQFEYIVRDSAKEESAS
jgi:hypothetical protein